MTSALIYFLQCLKNKLSPVNVFLQLGPENVCYFFFPHVQTKTIFFPYSKLSSNISLPKNRKLLNYYFPYNLTFISLSTIFTDTSFGLSSLYLVTKSYGLFFAAFFLFLTPCPFFCRCMCLCWWLVWNSFFFSLLLKTLHLLFRLSMSFHVPIHLFNNFMLCIMCWHCFRCVMCSSEENN